MKRVITNIPPDLLNALKEYIDKTMERPCGNPECKATLCVKRKKAIQEEWEKVLRENVIIELDVVATT